MSEKYGFCRTDYGVWNIFINIRNGKCTFYMYMKREKYEKNLIS